MSKQASAWEYTKIVATIGPASDTVEILKELMDAGMNVARLNTKHGTTEWHAERIDRIRQASKETGKPVSILLDLQGPEIRINIPNSEAFQVELNELIPFRSEFVEGEAKQVKIPQMVIDALQVGNEISIEDGFCEFEIAEKHDDHLMVKALNSFKIGDRKTMNTPGVVIDMPSLIETDIEKLDALEKHPVDFVALSFVRDRKDIDILKDEMKRRNIHADLVAKIENEAAIRNLDEIIENSDAVMVARGDLAVEIPMEQLTYWQKEIIRRCRAHGKPVITATQMLKSMVDNPRPTRAEVSDVANAVFDGTDAIMLSEETTIGKYPVKTVKTMRKIAQYNEQHVSFNIFEKGVKSRTTAITKMAMNIIKDNIEHIDAIVTLSETGSTAKQLTRHRPNVPVIVVTDREETRSRLPLLHGVYPVLHSFPVGKVDDLSGLLDSLVRQDLIKVGQTIIVTHGTMYKTPGGTNTVSIIDVK